MGKVNEMTHNSSKELEKMRKREELRKQLEKAKDQGAQDKMHNRLSM